MTPPSGYATAQVYMSTRRGAWILNRVSSRGLPKDVTISRFATFLASLQPRWVHDSLMERRLNARFDHELYGVKPAHRYSEHARTISDELPNRIITGSVIIKPDVK